jgi:hypothetical protein
MAKEPQTHSTTIELSTPVPAEVAVGAGLVVRVKVSCSAGCDLRGKPVKIVAPDGVVATAVLATYDDEANESEDIAIKAPLQVGAHAWTVVFEDQEAADVRHEDCSCALRVKTVPQGTSLAVWDIPSPVVMGERFEIKVGAKSAGDYELKGYEIEVCDKDGTVVARGQLQDTPWPGTTALYWTTVDMIAPDQEGLSGWSVRFAAADLAIPHDGAVAEFSVAVVRPPEHRLAVKVIEKESRAPIEDVQVRLGAYRGATGQLGLAEIMMPKGAYELHIWKAGYEAPSQTVDIDQDTSLEVEASIVPEADPDAAWTM